MPSRSLKNRLKSAKNRANKAVANGAVPIFVNTANNEFVNVINPENNIGYYSNGYTKPGGLANIFGDGSSVWRPATEEDL